MEKRCKCCGNILPEKSFYYSNNISKHSDGYLDICKDCLEKTINYKQCDTFLWIIKECDVPFFFDEWNKLVTIYQPLGKSVLTRYLSKMKLLDFRHMRWEDTFYFFNYQAEHPSTNYLRQFKKEEG